MTFLLTFAQKTDSIRRKAFIPYHHVDQTEVQNFIDDFDHEHDVFIRRALGVDMADDIINSNNTDYVMRRIKEDYLRNSTVTIVLIGKCTWSRRYVDWEIQASLRSGETVIPNGLIGILLPSAGNNPTLPKRLDMNLLGKNSDEGYARCYWYPKSKVSLTSWIEDAFLARTTRAKLLVNPRERFGYNKKCP